MKKYEVDGKIFDDEAEALAYCESQEISSANITIIEGEKQEETIQDTPEEKPTDEGISEKRVKKLQKIKAERILDNEVAEMYIEGELSETQKGQVLSKWLAKTEDKSQDPRIHDKEFRQVRTSANAELLQYQDTVKRLKDPENIACPVCHQTWEKLSKEEVENLAQNEKYEVGIPLCRIIHVKAKHPSIWRFIGALFKIPGSQSFKGAEEPYTSSRPENLTSEEIAEKLSEDPKARIAFMKAWQLRLQKEKRDK